MTGGLPAAAPGTEAGSPGTEAGGPGTEARGRAGRAGGPGHRPDPAAPGAAAVRASWALQVLFKRDDLTGVGLGGNKLRGLEFLIADALAQGCDSLVTGAGPAVELDDAGRPGLPAARDRAAHRLLRQRRRAAGGRAEGNMRLHRWLGVDVRFTGIPERPSVDAGIAAVTAELRAAGRRPYPVPRGGATPLGALGYVRASVELAAQLAGRGEPPAGLWLATGSCGTQAGLLAGAALTGAPYQVRGRDREPARWRSAGTGSGSWPPRRRRWPGSARTSREPDVRDGWIGPGYGTPSAAGQAAARLVAVTEGVFLDPVFGAKAMAALIAECRAGRVRGPQVFLVSGGAPTLFAGSAPGGQGRPEPGARRDGGGCARPRATWGPRPGSPAGPPPSWSRRVTRWRSPTRRCCTAA